MARPCTVCSHPDRETINQELIAGTSYRNVGKQFGVGVSAVFRHRRDHLTELLANALEARGARELHHGDELLNQLQGLTTEALSILNDSRGSGDNRTALVAISELRRNIELTARLTGELIEKHAHLHAAAGLTPEAQQQLTDAVNVMREYKAQLPPPGSIKSDIHLLEGAAALPGVVTTIEEATGSRGRRSASH